MWRSLSNQFGTTPGIVPRNSSPWEPRPGTTQFYGYACYTPQNREHVANLLGWKTGAVTRDYQNNDRTRIIQNMAATSDGAMLPANWRAAITETFLKNSTQAAGSQVLGALNIWILNTGVPGGGANPNCTSGMGMQYRFTLTSAYHFRPDEVERSSTRGHKFDMNY